MAECEVAITEYAAPVTEYAVLIPVVTTGSGEALLLEVRSYTVRQPGEICFPGGRAENGETPAETAVRETCEELGIQPEDIEITGEPVAEVMSDGRQVWSVSGRIDAESLRRVSLSGEEVAEIFLLPVDWLRTNPPAHFDLSSTPDEELPDKLKAYLEGYETFRRTGDTYYWEHEGHGIWGLTARIIAKHFQ